MNFAVGTYRVLLRCPGYQLSGRNRKAVFNAIGSQLGCAEDRVRQVVNGLEKYGLVTQDIQARLYTLALRSHVPSAQRLLAMKDIQGQANYAIWCFWLAYDPTLASCYVPVDQPGEVRRLLAQWFEGVSLALLDRLAGRIRYLALQQS